MPIVIRSALCLVIVVVTAFAIPASRSAIVSALSPAIDYFDHRRVETVLIIGNSRTYWHYMPKMVRELADSAHSPVRYAITVRAWGGASFEENWKDEEDQQLLKQHWDHVILQAESRAQSSEVGRQSFLYYGSKLLQQLAASHSEAALIVNWVYGEALWTQYGDEAAGARKAHIALIERDHRALAQPTNARIIDTCRIWELVHARYPIVELYTDGNHPTVAGSYLSAMMVFRYLVPNKAALPTYHPPFVTDEIAHDIREIVDRNS